jgi:CheY-like chemotaxis protein
MIQDPGKIKILVAEDDPSTRLLFTIGFKDPQFEVKIVSDGDEALKVYDTWKPDIILLDIIMPHRNGYQTLKEIRTIRNDRAATVVMVSSISDKQEILACAKLGIQGVCAQTH